MARINLEDIRAELKQDNWKVISEEYINLDTTMTFECPEGHRVYSPWKKIRQKRECPICKETYTKLNELKVVPKKKGYKRTLAIDQATYISGWSIYDGKDLIKFGIFSTTLDDEIARDNALKNWLISMINNWRPDYIAIEDLHFQDKGDKGGHMSITVFKMLARLQGVLMETCYEHKIPYKVCSPNTWRKHCQVKGNHRADQKRSMQLLAKQWYGVSISNDEADAVGIGKYVADEVGIEPIIENWE